MGSLAKFKRPPILACVLFFCTLDVYNRLKSTNHRKLTDTLHSVINCLADLKILPALRINNLFRALKSLLVGYFYNFYDLSGIFPQLFLFCPPFWQSDVFTTMGNLLMNDTVSQILWNRILETISLSLNVTICSFFCNFLFLFHCGYRLCLFSLFQQCFYCLTQGFSDV